MAQSGSVTTPDSGHGGIQFSGLVAGPVAMLIWLVTSGSTEWNDWPPQANRLFAILMLTAIWWLTEPIPMPATGLLALMLALLLRVYQGEKPATFVFEPFANPVVFFLLGGLFLAVAMSRHGLDRRFALWMLSRSWVMRRPVNVLLGLGLATGGMSMWISNTAATSMIFPVTMGMIAVLAENSNEDFPRSRFATAMLLMVAFSSTVGGLATPIGTMPNVVCLGYLREHLDVDVPFLTWMAVGLPLSAVIFIGLLAWLSRWKPRVPIELEVLGDAVAEQRCQLGSMKRGEVNTLIVFVTVVTLWVLPSIVQLYLGAEHKITLDLKARLPTAGVAMIAPVLLFLLPVRWRSGEFTLTSEDFRKIDWGTILLFGSGLSLGKLIETTGLGQIAGQAMFGSTGATSVWMITAVTTTGAVVLSILTSNTATAVMIIPMVIEMCGSAGIPPLWPAIGAAFGSSFGSSLPVSTPPNAIVYGSGLIPIRRMVAGGIVLDMMAPVLIWCTVFVAAALGWLGGEVGQV